MSYRCFKTLFFTSFGFTILEKFLGQLISSFVIYFWQVDFIIGREIEIGGIYKGIVTSVKEYGAFVEFNGGQQGLLHISELSHEPVGSLLYALGLRMSYTSSVLLVYRFLGWN